MNRITAFAALFATVALEGCVQTVENDNPHFASIADRCDNRLNRPVIVANGRGRYDAQAVNTQEIGCAGSKRTFEIIAARGE